MSIDEHTARALCALNNAFYEANAASFSQSRQSPWPGWDKLAEVITPLTKEGRPIRVLDVACGNLRFERFLTDTFPQAAFDFAAVDSCDELVQPSDLDFPVRYYHRDVVEALIDKAPLLPAEAPGGFDLVVSFGFMHHVPGTESRGSFLSQLMEQVRPGGMLAVSLWRFMQDDHLAAKAAEDTVRAQREIGPILLEPGDYLLGWNNQSSTYRYCHHFSESEITVLLETPAFANAQIIRHQSDGRTNALNEYLFVIAP